MTTIDDIRRSFTAACDAMVARKIRVIPDTANGSTNVDIDQAGIPYVAGHEVSVLGALVVAECLSFDAPSPAEPIMRTLGVDEGWLLWFIETDEGAVPPAKYLDASNLGRELRARYCK